MSRWRVRAGATSVLVVCVALTGSGSMLSTGKDHHLHVGRGSVAAGRAHTVLATPDGGVLAWGAGGRGQIGDGALVDRWTPTPVAGLDGVVSVAAGAAHTVALTRDGDVYAWGANTFGRIGDGTVKRRPKPVRVRDLTNVTMIAAGRAHTLALTADGQVHAWGRNTRGQLGIGNKVAALVPTLVRDLNNVVSIAAGDAHSLAVTRDGRVFAWGSNTSSMLGDGSTKDRLRPVAIALTDAVAVAGGAAHSLALLRNGAVYSWGRGANGELGTGSTKVATTPKVVSGLTAVAIAAGRNFSAAIRDDGRVVAWGANDSGQLGDRTTTRRLRPVFVDGVSSATALALGDAHGIAVTASGDVRTWGEGSSGRLGTGTLVDQSTPSEILSDIPDWGSDPSEEPVDTTLPSIVATTSPPLHEGWMTTPVTVTFQCADDVAVASCSSPVTVGTDGITQITGTAVDRAGNQAATTLVVGIDINPPALSISEPQDRSTVNASAVVVLGTANDVASGVAEVRCNGEPVEFGGGVVRCPVQLHPGRNDIIVRAIDALGHDASTAISVTRAGQAEAIALTPATRVMEVSEVGTLTLHDQFGVNVEGAQWTSSDDQIVELSDADPPALTARAIGSATIIAEKDGLVATASIEVSPALTAGTTRWTLPALPGLVSEPPLFANRVDASVPLMFTVETETWGEATLRAVTSEGEVLWQQHSPGIPLMGDSFGGVLSGVLADVNSGTDYRAYLRLGGGSIKPWRYDSAGAVGKPAQAADGTLYAIEYLFGGVDIDGYEVWDKYAVVINGASGRMISRTVLPREVDEFISDRDGDVLDLRPPVRCRTLYYDYAPETVGPVVGSDGRGYLVVRRHALHKRGGCIEPFQTRPDRTIDMGVDLVILSPAAAPQIVNVYSTSCSGTLGSTLPCDLPVRAFQLMPDGIGGTVVTWERGDHMVGTAVFVQRSMTRVDAEGALQERPVSPEFWLEMMGQAGTAVTYDDGWKAVDVTTGDIKWASSFPVMSPLAARPDGGLALLDWSTGELKTSDAAGNIASAQPFGLDWRSVHDSGDWIGLRGSDLAAVVGEFQDATRWSALRGNVQNQLSVRKPGVGVWLKTHNAIGQFPFQHASIRVAPRNQDWLLKNRTIFESCAPPSACVPLGKDGYENLFFTIGAGTESGDSSVLCTGMLTKGFNRPKDVTEPPTSPLRELPVDPQLEPIIINSLLARVAGYNNQLAYHCFPEEHPGFYNSNSFTHGLLHAAGVEHDETAPSRRSIPGWLTPVQVDAFFVR